jgi:transcriptional regulator with XRE-family HTH domain
MAHTRNEKIILLFGQRVRAIRQSKGLTMETLAALAGVDYRQIARIEAGIANVTISTASQIAAALEVTLGSLLDA